MRVLVTGCDGFLGQVLVLRLRELGHTVTALGRGGAATSPTSVRRLQADLTDPAAVARAVTDLAIDGVCHLAAVTDVRESFTDPLRYYAVNLGGTLHLLEALTARPGTRLVFVSSGAVYGTGHARAVTEDLPARPESPYAASKLAAESLVAAAAGAGLIGAAVLRCFNVAGGYAGRISRNPAGIIAAALRAAASEAPHVTINGDGTAVRGFTHVLDVADAIVLALDTAVVGRAEVFNVGSEVGVTIRDVVAAAARVTGRQIDVVHRPAAAEPHTLLADTRLIRDRLGWQPRHSGVEEIIRSDWDARRRAASR